MDSVFMNSGNCKMSYPHRLVLNLTNNIDSKRRYKCVGLSNLSICYTWKNIKKFI